MEIKLRSVQPDERERERERVRGTGRQRSRSLDGVPPEKFCDRVADQKERGARARWRWRTKGPFYPDATPLFIMAKFPPDAADATRMMRWTRETRKKELHSVLLLCCMPEQRLHSV